MGRNLDKSIWPCLASFGATRVWFLVRGAPMPRWSALIRSALGAVLLAAAGSKLYGLSVSAVPPIGWFAQPWVQLAAVEWEVVLGLWLVTGVSPRGSWLAAVGTFVAFAGVSGYLGAKGVASCGCLGVIHASPWWAFGIDAAAVALLTVACPREIGKEHRASGRGAFGVLAGTAAILILLTAAGIARYGSTEAALAHLRGEALTLSPRHLDFGDGHPGQKLEATIEVWNWTDAPVRLIGGTSDCSCVTTDGLPVTIPPGESASVPIRIVLPGETTGAFTRKAVIWTDCDRAKTIRLTLGGRAVE